MKYFLALLLSLNVFFLYEWRHTNTSLLNERASHTKDIDNFKNAQTQANAKAELMKQTLKKEAQASANEADLRYDALLDQYRTNLLRYQANQSVVIRPDNYQYPTAESSDRPSTDTDVSSIRITIDDAEVCAVNTARLQAVHDWAIKLPK